MFPNINVLLEALPVGPSSTPVRQVRNRENNELPALNRPAHQTSRPKGKKVVAKNLFEQFQAL
jgi:hypothetical protein